MPEFCGCLSPLQKWHNWDFSGGLVVDCAFTAEDVGLIPGQGTKIPPCQKKKIKANNIS